MTRIPKNVVLFSWDATEKTVFRELFDAGRLPFVQSLPHVVDMVDNLEWSSGTATRHQHATMISGYLANMTGIHSNEPTQNLSGWSLPRGLSVFERVCSWFWLNKPYVAGGTGKPQNVGDMIGYITQTCPHTVFKGWQYNQHGFDKFYNGWQLIQDYPPDMHVSADLNARAIALPLAENKPPFLYFFHFADPDHVGHHYNVLSQQYRDAIVNCDNLTGEICNKLAPSQPAIIVTSDHGFGDSSGNLYSHIGTPNSFLATNLPIVRTAHEFDVAPTIYYYLGLPYKIFKPPIQGESLMLPTLAMPEMIYYPTEEELEEIAYGHEGVKTW